jgi:hypothetical protein
MIILQETTKDLSEAMRHTYIVTDAKDKVVAYIKSGTKEVIEFSKPLRFSTKHRTFREIRK